MPIVLWILALWLGLSLLGAACVWRLGSALRGRQDDLPPTIGEG